MAKEDENCFGHLDKQTGGQGGFRRLSRRRLAQDFDATGQQDGAQGVGFFNRGDGQPYHVAHRGQDGSYSHRSGPGAPVEGDLSMEDLQQQYPNDSYLPKFLRRRRR